MQLSCALVTNSACTYDLIAFASACFLHRLGHRVQQDEFLPRKVEEFRGRISVPADAVVRSCRGWGAIRQGRRGHKQLSQQHR